MKMKKKYKLLLSILAIAIILLIGLSIHKLILNKPKEEKTITNVANVTNKIEGYNYTLDDRDNQLFESTFKELKENLESDEINEEEYAKSLAKLFIIDIYTIENKVSKYDIGGLEYLNENAKDSFRAKLLDTLYKTVEDDSYKTRTQELPNVKSIEVNNITTTSYKMGGTDYEAYEVTLSWTYEKDLGYDKSGTITMIKEEKRLDVTSYNPGK